nr:hypothetical protein [Halorubrum rutilum]
MTAFEELKHGDIVWGDDPLSDKGRPMLVLGTPRFPEHGVQLITVLISTKSRSSFETATTRATLSGSGVTSSRGRS